ncbi:PKD domain-containing protein [bacterium]|nr:PKD domain-containing protein [bacterium]MBU4602859.1 PKD domain-containing protein [bacterium]
MQYKNKKNLYKILFITILLGFIISLVGCNWLSLGLLNIFDPQAQIRLNYTEVNLEDGSISLEIYSLNEVEYIGTGFEYEYYNGTTKITSLTKMVGVTFYVEPSTSPGTPGPITTIDNMPLYFQEVLDYLTLNPLVIELTCNINMVGVDGAGHNISKTVTIDLPALQPGIDFEPPVAVINVTPGTTGTAPFKVVFDAYGSTDNRGIASYSWDFGDGTTGTGVMPAAHTYTNGAYIVKLTVTDYFGNVGVALVTITVGEAGAPTAVINVTPSTTGIAPFTVYFDASQSSVADGGEGCGSCSIVSYVWNFGDGTPNGTGMTISHTYAAAGTYIVVLTVTDSNGNMGYDSETIKVNAAGVPSTITLLANPTTVTAGGGTSLITATVKDAGGNPVTDGTTVTFNATLGSLTFGTVVTASGIATTTLTLANSGTETVSSTVSATSGTAIANVVVYCPPPTP